MGLSDYVDPTRCWQLLSGVLGIYVSYLVTGLAHESMLKQKYTNDVTGTQDPFTWPSAFLIFPCGATWIIGTIVNHFQIPPQEKTHIPAKNSAICAATVSVSTLTYTYAIYLTNFPVVMMFKSCNLISVILVGVLCSRVKDKKVKLATKKIVVGVIITIGILMFKIFDPESSKKNQKQTQIIGIVLLIVSLLADGFLPDFQAQIKSVYKPKPMQMMTDINKWVAIISTIFALALMELGDIFLYLYQHKLFLMHMTLMGVLSTFGQMFVYRMIKQFKQHFAPFVITTRKIFTVGLSIIYYHHETNFLQLLGLVLVFALVTYEFVSELVQQKSAQKFAIHEQPASAKNEMSMTQVNDPPTQMKAEDQSQQISQVQIQTKQKQKYEERIGKPE